VRLSKKEADNVEIWKRLEEYKNSKKILDVVVKNVVKGGLITYIDGFRAFIPQSQLGENRDLNSYVGKTISLNVIEFNKDRNKIILSRKEIEANEREKRAKNAAQNFYTSHKPGDVFDGVVVKLLNFGALVEIEKDIVGLVHISEISDKSITKVSDALAVHDKVKVKILAMDNETKKISLTIKDAVEAPKEKIDNFVDSNSMSQNLGTQLRDKLKDFKFKN
ncbi:MAG: S1 RNA-binding domain-containing protein, partial [Oscillospiraceae bacterium]|nr:S1 RNA-binding domain-containing protein [Oscillospiraceae bacterium]